MKMPDVTKVEPKISNMSIGLARAVSGALQDLYAGAELSDKEQLQVCLALLSGLIGGAASIIEKINDADKSENPLEAAKLVVAWLDEMLARGQSISDALSSTIN